MENGMKKLNEHKKLVMLGLILAVSVLIWLPLNSLDADNPYYAELIDDDGNEITEPIVKTSISFSTEYTQEGLSFITPDAEVRLDTIGSNLRVVSAEGEFNIVVSAENVTGMLAETGILIKAFDGENIFATAKLESAGETPFEAYFVDTNGDDAIFAHSKVYSLQIFTASKYESDQPPVSSSEITFGFEPELIGGYRTLTFMSDGEVLLQGIYSTDSQIGSFPPVEEKPGYRLAGWYVGDDFEVKTDTYVRDLPGEQDVTIEARWILAPSGDWPKITDRLIDEQISDDKKIKTWETTYLWQDGSKYIIDSIITTDLDDNYLSGYADAVFKVKGQEDCSLRIIDDGDRILVFVPQINNLFLQ